MRLWAMCALWLLSRWTRLRQGHPSRQRSEPLRKIRWLTGLPNIGDKQPPCFAVTKNLIMMFKNDQIFLILIYILVLITRRSRAAGLPPGYHRFCLFCIVPHTLLPSITSQNHPYGAVDDTCR
jgi:hypothetical protein